VVSWRKDEMSQQIVATFTAETGVPVTILPYSLPDGGEQLVRNGEAIDVTLVSNRTIPALTAAGLLRPLDLHHLPNFKNISPSFRDLSFDPGNRHSVPFAWGVSGLVARSDLVFEPITSWADLWDPKYCGRIAVWIAQKRAVIGAALKSLGYSANTEIPAELAAVRARLQALKPCVRVVKGDDVIKYIPAAIRGELVLGVGNAHEAFTLRTFNLPFHYYLPQEGALLWGDSLVIPAAAPQPQLAEQFIDFVLRPEISAQFANINFYQLANEAARPLIVEKLREDPMLYPTTEALRQAEILLPLSAEASKLYDEIWQEFTAGPVE
jgi:spermidine/putrescine transport system substrate-binding protein